METGQKEAILIIADISGYTRFMLANQTALAHSQAIITELIQAIINEVEIPLQVAKLEGDAVFLYAIKEQEGVTWDFVRKSIGAKLITFFKVFANKLAELSQVYTCGCGACSNIDRLRLKIVAHSGQAYLHCIGRFEELTGVDVIITHRLLKNSVPSNQYILMTESAYREIEFPQQVEVTEGEEIYQDIGRLKTCTFFPERR